jgi:hypothetical protein
MVRPRDYAAFCPKRFRASAYSAEVDILSQERIRLIVVHCQGEERPVNSSERLIPSAGMVEGNRNGWPYARDVQHQQAHHHGRPERDAGFLAVGHCHRTRLRIKSHRPMKLQSADVAGRSERRGESRATTASIIPTTHSTTAAQKPDRPFVDRISLTPRFYPPRCPLRKTDLSHESR